ncbi:MAG: metal-dependent hydrolase [Janthinobacterium lividum]
MSSTQLILSQTIANPIFANPIMTGPIVTSSIITSQNIGALAVLTAGAALLPDLDAQHSKIRSLRLGPLRPFNPLGALIYGAWGHRGPLHSLPGLAVFGLIAALPLALTWGPEYGAAVLLGYGSHLALDAMTRHGIPLLPARGRDGRWGFRFRRHLLPRRFRFVTGSAAEELLQAVLFSLSLLLLIKSLV